LNFGFKQDLDFETVSLSKLDLILKWNCWLGLGFEKPKSVHLCCCPVGPLCCRPVPPDEESNKKPNNQTFPKKRPEKGQTDCLEARKKPNFVRDVVIPLSPGA